MFRFVPDTVGGVGSKRKHAAKSCETCKKRHKRCHHNAVSPVEGIGTLSTGKAGSDDRALSAEDELRTATAQDTSTVTSIPMNETTAAASSQARKTQTSNAPRQLASPSAPTNRHGASQGAYLRFVGDLSPEASFLMNQKRQSGPQKRRDEIGVWLGQKPDEASTSEDLDAVQVEPTSSPAFRLDGLTGLKAIYPYLRKECMSVLPPDYDFSLMSDLYFAKFDPIYPILHGEDLEAHDPLDAAVLKQGICLMASLDPSLRTHLRLSHTEAVLSQNEFRSTIATALKHALDAGFIRHKMVLLQVTALMAFYVDQPKSSEISSHLTAQAVGLTQTLGLHLGWPSDGVSTGKASRIFWCIWTLDRLNAATNGRPIMIHRQDMDKRIFESVDEQQPAFRLFIRLSQFLDETISQYRPQSSLGSATPIDTSHTFEGFVREAEAGEIGSSILASLELFYLAVVILQSRPQPSATDSARVPSSNLQSFCALGIVAIASEEFKSSMTYWAVLPYAVSLSTSAAYQSLRNSSLPYKRKQAHAIFCSSCDVLDDLGTSFVSARAMARLAKDTLLEVERVSGHRSRTRQLQSEGEGEGRSRGEKSGASGVDSNATTPPGLNANEDSAARVPPAQAVDAGHATDVEAVPGPFDADLFGGLDMEDAGAVFGEFNPGFQLDHADAVFSANLNPTMPFFPEHWLDGDTFGYS